MVQKERVRLLNGKAEQRRKYVLYWMQAAQRGECNHALEYAASKANERGKPLVVVFGLTDDYPQTNERHYYFMLEGLRETKAALNTRGMQMVVMRGRPDECAVEFAEEADLVVVDGGQLKIQKQWRKNAAQHVDCELYEVEANLIMPVWEASSKEDFSAGTFRPKIKKKLRKYLVGLEEVKLKRDSLGMRLGGIDISDIDEVIAKMKIDRSVKKVHEFRGGTSEAKRLLADFIEHKLAKYDRLRNEPSLDYVSNMSPYLHFGQISPLYIALEIIKKGRAGKKAYLEELIVRRELSHNFVYYNENYDNFDAVPLWAQRTLNYHNKDKREYVYSVDEFENSQTHDPYWNAAQKEMVLRGKMHGYMRMYWGKKILEWSRDWKRALQTALYLNNKYELDGRDANGFTGVMWCFGKHDRAWGNRTIVGKVRYMNADGLKRKFDIEGYVKKVQRLGTERSRL